MDWTFQGRDDELRQLQSVFSRNRFFFARLTGRRRIGKTTLVHEALRRSQKRKILYVQIPDSGSAGVLSSVHDAASTFEVPRDKFPPPTSLRSLATYVRLLVEDGYFVVLDEFQYFTRKPLRPFSSYMQVDVDALMAKASRVPGGLVVLGSLQAEMNALLQDRHAPLFSRTTDEIDVTHLDVPTIARILEQFGCRSPSHLLFLWNLFEGVPKFYRDCFEQDVLTAPRRDLLRKIFFSSSAPLRTEADNWFLKELRGRYDTVLKYVARNPGRDHADITAHTRDADSETAENIAVYLKILQERFALIEARQPFGSKPNARRRRYYLRDHFLTAWLSALAPAVSASTFRPLDTLVAQADDRLFVQEGRSFERMTHQLWEGLSRKGIPEFSVTQPVSSWWSRHAELDLVGVNAENEKIIIGSCKRSGSKLATSLAQTNKHIEAFNRANNPKKWQIVRVAIAPHLTSFEAKEVRRANYTSLTLSQMLEPFGPGTGGPWADQAGA